MHRRIAYRFLLRHPWQLALALLGVALGVAVVVSIDLTRVSAERAFERSSEALSGRATHRIVGGPHGLDERVYAKLKLRLGVHPAAPVLSDYATLPGHPGETLQLLGIDPLAEVAFRELWAEQAESLVSRPSLLALFTQPRSVLLGRSLAERLGLSVHGRLSVRIGSRIQTVRVLAILDPRDALARQGLENVLLMDLASAQEVLGMAGRLSHIDLIIPAGGKGGAQLTRIRAALPPGLAVLPAGSRGQAMARMTRAFHVNLAALSLLALLVGAFLIYNTLSFLVVQQRPIIGTLRALGMGRLQVFQTVFVQALLIGALGTAAGVLLGIALAHGLIHLVTRTINDLYFVVAVRSVTLAPLTLLKGLSLGLAASACAALTPAWEAAAVHPRTALQRSELEAHLKGRLDGAAWAGIGLLALGALLAAWPSRRLGVGFAALFIIMLGAALLTPKVASGLLSLLSVTARHWRWIGLRLALRSASRALSRTAVAMAALMVAVATTVSMGLMIGSFRHTVSDWLGQLLRADLYISIPGSSSHAASASLSPALAERVRRAAGVAAVSTVRRLHVEQADGWAELIVYQLAAPSYAGFRFLSGDPRTIWRAFDTRDAVLVSEPFAYHHRLSAGARLTLRTEQGLREFHVAGLYYDYGSEHGAIAMSRRTFERHWGDRRLSSIGVYALEGVSLQELRNRVQAILPVGRTIVVSATREILTASLQLFDRSFAITEVLRLLAGLVAFLGVLGALMAVQLERRREHALLRALGISSGQLGGLVLTETTLIGAIAGLLALPVATLIAGLLVHIVLRRSFGWSMPLHVEPLVLLQGLLVALLAAFLAGLHPAFRSATTLPADGLRRE